MGVRAGEKMINDLGARCCDICDQSVVIPARMQASDAKRQGNGGMLQQRREARTMIAIRLIDV
jgi:hypothetical protein